MLRNRFFVQNAFFLFGLYSRFIESIKKASSDPISGLYDPDCTHEFEVLKWLGEHCERLTSVYENEFHEEASEILSSLVMFGDKENDFFENIDIKDFSGVRKSRDMEVANLEKLSWKFSSGRRETPNWKTCDYEDLIESLKEQVSKRIAAKEDGRFPVKRQLWNGKNIVSNGDASHRFATLYVEAFRGQVILPCIVTPISISPQARTYLRECFWCVALPEKAFHEVTFQIKKMKIKGVLKSFPRGFAAGNGDTNRWGILLLPRQGLLFQSLRLAIQDSKISWVDISKFILNL